ncbi:MAG: Hsp33 family molecular chaperone HslO [Oscillospiraceae bacterium]
MGRIVRYISEDGGIICCAVDTTDMVNKAEQIHKTSATVTAALGRLLTGTSIMGYMLKGENDSVTTRLDGKGPVGSIIAVSDSKGNTKGYATNPIVEIPLNKYGKLDVSGAVGKDGFLTVMKEMGDTTPYTGHSPIVSGEIAEDFTYYYAKSEQIPTVCALGVLVNTDLTVLAAGGYLVQLLPGATDETIDKLELNVDKMPAISSLIADGKTPDDVTKMIMDGFQPQLLDENIVEYRCDCSRDRIEKALISVGKDELFKMAEEQEDTQVECYFCNRKEHFSAAQIRNLAKQSSNNETDE